MTFEEALHELWGDEYRETMRDIADHGADSGFPGITYYSDTVALYRAHEDEIWDKLAEMADGLGESHPLALIANFAGAKDVGSATQLANLLVWFMVEELARNVDL